MPPVSCAKPTFAPASVMTNNHPASPQDLTHTAFLLNFEPRRIIEDDGGKNYSHGYFG
jgi:hypothetical protein